MFDKYFECVLGWLKYLFVASHCYQRRNWLTSWYLGARSSQGAVPNPRASPRIAGTPGSGVGHWMRTPHSSGSKERKRQLSISREYLAIRRFYLIRSLLLAFTHLMTAFLSSPHIKYKNSVKWSAGKQVQVADIIKKPWQRWVQGDQMRR